MTNVMWQMRRIRLDRVGAAAARFLDVDISLADADGHPLDSIVWLRNGGGKSTVLSLVCALIRPHRREFLATATTDKHLEDYVLGSDTAHVTVEWSGPAGRRLVTGAVYEWSERTQPADPNRDYDKLQARWYAFTPVPGRAEFDLLPFTRDGQQLALKEFVAAVRSWDAIPGCGAVVSDAQDRWSRALDERGLDPELFVAILQMNATEGGIEGQFQFRNADQFVKYLLELIVDPTEPRKVSDILEQVRAGLAERPAIIADLTFADEAVPQLRKLASARTDHLTAVGMLTAAQDAASGTRAALVAAAQQAASEQSVQAQIAETEAERATAERRLGDLDYNRSVEFRRIGAMLRQRVAEALRDQLVGEQRRGQTRLDAWRAVPRIAALSDAQRRVRTLQTELEAVTVDAEPLRQTRAAAAAVFAAALDAAVVTLDAERAAAEDEHVAQTERAAAAKRRRTERLEERARAETRLTLLTETLTALDDDVAAARDAGHVQPGETLAAAVSRHREADEQAARRLEGLVAERAALTDRRNELGRTETQATAERTRVRLEAQQLRSHRDALTARVSDLAGRERLRQLAEADDVDVLAEGADLIAALTHQVTQADRRRVELAVDGAEDDRAAAALATTGLLPPVLDVVKAIDECERAGLAVTTGWAYLADSVPSHLRLKVLAAAPALVGGVLVHDPAELPRAQEQLTRASLRPTSAVTVATTADLHSVVQVAEAGTTDATFVVPTAPALTDRAKAGEELQLREVARDTRASDDERWARQRDADDDLRRSIRGLLADCPPGTLEHLEAVLARLDTELAAAEELLGGLPPARAVLDAEERELNAGDAQAQQVRRAAATAISVLTGLVTRLADAEALRAEAHQMPSQIDALADAIQAADNEEADALVRAEEQAAAVRDRKGLLKDLVVQRAGLGDDVLAAAEADLALDDARAAWEAADAAYRRETSESALAAALDEARRAVNAPAAEVAALPREIREHAERLHTTPDGFDPQLAAASLRAAIAEVERLGKDIGDAELEVKLAAAEVDQHTPKDRRRRAPLDEHEIPATREEAIAAAEGAEASQRAHIEAEGAAQEKAVAAERARNAAELRAEAMRTQALLLGGRRDDVVGDDIAPYAGTSEDARLAVDHLRNDLTAAQTLESQTREVLGGVSNTLVVWATDERFAAVKPDVRGRFRVTDAAGELGPNAEELADDLTVYAANLRGRLEELEAHKDVVVDAMSGMVRQALRTIERAQRLSELPPSLGPWAGHRFLEVGPRASVNTAEAIVRDRCSRLVDTLTMRGVEVPRGLDLLWQATNAVVGDGNWKAKVLKPSTTFALDRVPVEKMRKWSGGEKVTISLLLFCMVAKLRAQNRGRELPGLGVLPLDNPLGKANYVVFLDLQRKVAAANGIQLLFLTGVGDMKAVGRFPNIIRMRNTANASREYVRIAERVLTDDDPAGVVDATRVWRDDPVLKLL